MRNPIPAEVVRESTTKMFNRPVKDSAAVRDAVRDGYTIVIGHIGTLAVTPTLYSKLKYDPLKDFDPITLVSKLPNLMAVNPTVPAKTVAQFIALAKSRPGKLNYGSGGTGGAGHLATEYFRLLTRIDLVHVPYRGTGLAVIDVISGQLDMVMANPASYQHYQEKIHQDIRELLKVE